MYISLQMDLQAANTKVAEANKGRVLAQEELKKQTKDMLEQVSCVV